MTGYQWFGILFLFLGVLFLLIAALFFYVQYVFDRRPEQTGKAFGYRRGAKQKDNVILYGGRPTGRLFLRHLTKAAYLYTVNEKDYRIRHEHIGTKKETPRTVQVVYWKRFPRFSYISSETSIMSYSLWAYVILFWAAMAFLLGFRFFE